ncbi:MAG: hypothetical protein L0323_07950 [Planctomycetes bacterium]|nr:hypothetical protein [Planctomycetota bacterium]
MEPLRQLRRFAVSAGILGFLLLPAALGGGGGTTLVRVSVDSTGAQADGDSLSCSISDNGRFVAFDSLATNLVPGDTNGASDVFVHDVKMGTTVRVSVDSQGAQGNAASSSPSISGNGRFVVFLSLASNLVPGDTNGARDVFVHDVRTGATVRASVDSEGAQADEDCFFPSISGNGKVVAFQSAATNLVPGDTGGNSDVFVHDVKTGSTIRVSVDSEGVQGNEDSFTPAISANGKLVAFQSAATNLVAGDANAAADVFVHDVKKGTTIRASVDSEGAEAGSPSFSPAVSGSGKSVAFASGASDLVPGDTNGEIDVLVRDLKKGTTTRVSVDSAGAESNGGGVQPSISKNGRTVAFQSESTDLVPGDTNGASDIFVRDAKSGTTTRVSVDAAGVEADSVSDSPSISGNARFVAFRSLASNLVPGDTNAVFDIFVRRL